MKIFIDMDGVLSNFVGGVAPLLGTDEHELSSKLFLHQTYNIADALDTRWEHIEEAINDQGVEFWSGLNRYHWAEDLLIYLLEETSSSNIYIVTDPGQFQYSHAGKMLWMKEHLGYKFKNYAMTPYKHLLADRNSILIDDNRNNVSAFKRAGGRAILFPQPWNSSDAEQYNIDRLTYTLNKVKEHAKEITS